MQRIIGESTSLAETLDHVSRVAPLDRPILVIGERGSGKEMIAERLHYLSKRWEESFDKVNCAAISEQLLDSELFGHEPGSFTGATKLHLGRFERAHGGTLFLDELATMPMRIQEKLLRIIEYGEFERLGGQNTIQVDVRIVAATNEHLPALADKGEFRHDLLDRLAFDVVHVPPLRERKGDIPVLVEHFAANMSIELEWDYYAGFTGRAMTELLAHRWPGNIRELRNAVERSLCHWSDAQAPVDSVLIDPFKRSRPQTSDADSPDDTHQTLTAPPTRTPAATRGFQETIKDMEISLIKQALQACQGHQKNAAKLLGLSYHQLRALLKKYRDALNPS